MDKCTNSRKIMTLKDKLMQCVVKLGNLKVPAHIIFYEKNEVFHFGTLKAMDKFEATNACKCNCTCGANNSLTWSEALKKDELHLAKADGSVFDQEKIIKTGISNYMTTLQKPKKMRAPLSVATLDEITHYLKYLILLEHAERGLQGTNIAYGDEKWRPRNCWIEHEFSWSQVYGSLKNIKSSDYTGPGRLIDFYKRCVKKGLDARGIDPEKYYSEEFSDQELKRRRRRRGILSKGPNEELDGDSKRLDENDLIIENKETSENRSNRILEVKIEKENTANGIDHDTFIADSIKDYHFRFNGIGENIEHYNGNDKDTLKGDSIEDYVNNIFDSVAENNVNVEINENPFQKTILNGPYSQQGGQKGFHVQGTYYKKSISDRPRPSDAGLAKRRRGRPRKRTEQDETIPEKRRRKGYENEKRKLLIETEDNSYRNSDETSNKIEKKIDHTELDQEESSRVSPIHEEQIRDRKIIESSDKDSPTKSLHNECFNFGSKFIDKEGPKLTEVLQNQENIDSGYSELTRFFASISLPDLADLFISEDVTMEVLSEMSGEDLKEIGVSKFGQRFRILKYVKKSRICS